MSNTNELNLERLLSSLIGPDLAHFAARLAVLGFDIAAYVRARETAREQNADIAAARESAGEVIARTFAQDTEEPIAAEILTDKIGPNKARMMNLGARR